MTQHTLDANSRIDPDAIEPYHFPIIPQHNVIVTSGDAYVLQQYDRLIVNQGIAVETMYQFGSGVLGLGSNTIDCDGAIFGYYGVELGESGALTVGATGLIEGTYAGVELEERLSNEDSTNNDHFISNHGTIFGSDHGITINKNDGAVTINNSGRIVSGARDDFASAIASNTNASVHLSNTGLIKSELEDSFAYSALAIDTGTDTIVNAGTMIGNVALGGGNDIVDTSKGKIVGTIDAGTGNDKITGSAFADTISGKTGNDTFIFKTKPDNHAIDHITDFDHGHDELALSRSLFKLDPGQSVASAFQDITAGFSGEGVHKHILYNHSNGALYYDTDGKGGAAPLHFATLDHHPTLTSGDILMV